jgi:hypothetical protein
MNLYGGTIEKGYATEKGGNINIQPSKTLNMSGGTVTDGFAGSHSGNIYINDNGLCSITGGLVTKGTTNGQGGNMAVTGKLHITGGEVSDGLADVDLSNAGHGGNIWISGANAEFIVKNAKILNGGRLNYEVYGGNIFVNNNGAKVFEIGEGAVISGGKAHRGGNIYIGHLTRNFNTYKITGGTITGGSASYLGTNIVLFGTSEANMPVLTISGGEIKEAGNGINVALGASTSNCYAKVIMTGGSVTGGRLVVYPGGVFDATAGGTLSYNTLTLGSSQTTHGQILLPTP